MSRVIEGLEGLPSSAKINFGSPIKGKFNAYLILAYLSARMQFFRGASLLGWVLLCSLILSL